MVLLYMKPRSTAGRGSQPPDERAAVLVASTAARPRVPSQHQSGAVGVGNGRVGEALELLVGEQHHVVLFADHHAGGGVVAEMQVLREAERLVEGNGAREICDRQIDEDLLPMGSVLFGVVKQQFK